MLRTIKSKLIFGVLIIIFFIQAISSVYQFQKIKSIIIEESMLGIQNLAEPIFVEIRSKISVITSDDTTEEEFDDYMNLYAQITASSRFKSLLEAKQDFHSMQFVSNKGKTLALTMRIIEAEKTIIKNLNSKELKTHETSEDITNLTNTKVLGTTVKEKTSLIYIPFAYKEKFLGGLVVNVSNQRLTNARNEILMMTFLFMAIYMLVACVMMVLLIQGVLSKPIKKMILLINNVSIGDLDNQFQTKKQDEISQMGQALNELIQVLASRAKTANLVADGNLTTDVALSSEKDSLGDALQKMISNLNGMIKDISYESGTLSTSSSSLKNISEVTAGFTKDIEFQSDTVTSAAIEMSVSIKETSEKMNSMRNDSQSISATTTQMAHSMKSITERFIKMTEAIQIVAETAGSGSVISEEARKMSMTVIEEMRTLSTSAIEIGKVTDIIKEIAQQTNLLALNANIEAASAGEAGKGFAVVANEIKELAKQSASAAEDITYKIKDIQSNTESTSKTIDEMSKTVASTSESSNDIAELAEEQQETAVVISSNVTEANSGIEEIAQLIEGMSNTAQMLAKNTGELSKASNEISTSMDQIKTVTQNSRKNSEQIQQESSTLTKVSLKLEDLVKSFQTK